MNRTTVGAAVAALFLGIAAGGSIVYQVIPPQEPRACELTREMTPEVFFIQSNLLSAAVVRGNALGMEDYEDADRSVREFVSQLEEIQPEYEALYDECEAAS